jgi:hypothetical protein
MKIKDIFKKNIDRAINPAVVVSKQDEATVKTEIEEYVFTQAIIENLYKYLITLINSRQDKTGIWINGFYGSGKSHFIKYIYYCLNSTYSSDAFQHYIDEVRDHGDKLSEASPGNITSLQKKLQKTDIDTIIFNIDAVSGQRDDREKITKIFFNQFNAFRGYNSTNIPLALLLEKHLDQMGLFDEFKAKINEKLKTSWETKAAQISALKLNDILNVAKELDSTLDIDSLRVKLKNPDDITISDHLIPEFVEYLASKPDNYRLIFLVDEISQYISANSNLLLNLQTIIEEIGSKCDNKIWLTCTAQQTIEDLVQSAQNPGDDFGKILGRFETRISLESQDTTYITQKRILDKNSEGRRELADFYKSNKDAIENQFIFSHDRYRGYEDKEHFILSYPFVPYQFKLISDVFENFANLGYVIKEVKDNERSILGITHFTAREHKEEPVGRFITFDAFFNDQLKSNVTHHANKILEPALLVNEVKNDMFAKKVVLTLFMISNVTDPKKLTFPSNVDNLTTLLLDNPDANRLELQNKVEGVLDVLIEKSIIYKEDGRYYFYKEEEIDIAKQIQNTTITMDDRLSYFHSDIFDEIFRFQKKASFGNNNFSLSLNIDEKEIIRNGDLRVFFSIYDKTTPEAKAFNVNKTDLVCCVNEWFMSDDSIRREFEQYVKTQKFIRLNSDSAVGTRRKAMEKFSEQNRRRVRDLQKQFQDKFSNTKFISNQQILKPGDINGSTPKARLDDAIEKHLSEIYKKNHLADSYAITNDDLKKSAADPQRTTDNSLNEAESLVNAYIGQLGESVTVYDIVNHFLKQPYGWKDTATIDMLIKLFKKGKRKFEWRSDIIDIHTFVDKAIKQSERAAIVAKPQEEIGSDTIKEVRNSYRTIFNQDLHEDSDANALIDEIKNKLQDKLLHYQKLTDAYFGKYPFGKHFNELTKSLDKIINTRDSKALFDHLIKFRDNLKRAYDNCKELEDFVHNQFERYDAIKDFTEENRLNFESLNEAEVRKSENLIDYFKNDDMPGNRFPEIKAIYDELSKSLKRLVDELRDEAVKKYEVIYTELDAAAQGNGIKEPASVYYPKDTKLKNIQTEKNISNLQLLLSQAGDFKANSIKSIYEYREKQEGGKARSIEVIDLQSTTINNEDDLEKYITDIRAQVLKKLKDNIIVIIK